MKELPEPPRTPHTDGASTAITSVVLVLASRDETLRGRMAKLLRRAPIGYPGFWLAALASLGECVDWTASLPEDPGI